MRLTRQGVRNLDGLREPEVERFPSRFWANISCDHKRMKSCCTPSCGHYHCPDCGVSWDHYAGK